MRISAQTKAGEKERRRRRRGRLWPFRLSFSCGFGSTDESNTKMTRGNQRELARQKNAKKANDGGKGKRGDDGLSAAARKQRDAEIMQQKQKKSDGSDGGKEPPKSK
ncbi:small EDRK-rich factor 2 [Nerophis lumbriciformis]|uniref:small EDRK-rich factor 2 n=2 Tax=Syngnathinae TaxID=129914 RepID=UPI002ADFB05D|nr:small EDRK-rich factor 2-like [Nerophis lumbriciformis]